MAGNKLKYTFRNLYRNRLNAVITLIGLSIALASVLVIYLFVSQERSYNGFHSNADRIYRLNYTIKLKDGNVFSNTLIDPELAEELPEKVSQVENCTPYRTGYMAQIDMGDHNRKVNLGIAEQPFFNMFDFKLLYGSRDELLVNPTNVVLTKSLAEIIAEKRSTSYDQLIGESIKFTFISDKQFTITGILEDVPENSSISFELLIPYEYQGSFWQSNNQLGNSTLFYELKEGVNTQQAQELVSNVVKEFYAEGIEQSQKSNMLSSSDDCFKAFSMPIKEVYLDTMVESSYEKRGNNAQLNILSVVAILILFIAFSNYIILTIGQFVKRAGEISIRKSIGGSNIDILKIFLAENSVLILGSFIIGGALSLFLVPIFNIISQSQIHFNLVNGSSLISFSVITIILLIALTSIVPVFVFNSVQPSLVPSKKLAGGKKAGVSQFFVGLQYVLIIILLIATIVINKQTNYLKDKSLGFNEESIISVDVTYLDQSTSVVLRDLLSKQSGVQNAALTNRNYFDGYSSRSFKVGSGFMEVYMFKADQYFIPTLDLQVLDGRNFLESEVIENNKSIIVNEEFVKRMGFDGSPIGQYVDGGREFNIVGVVNDYQFFTSREKIAPMALFANPAIDNPYSSIMIKYNPMSLPQIIEAIESGWKEIGTKEDLDYVYWDQELKNRYEAEERLSDVILYASIIAIIILVLGLFGITVLISAQRTNEVGIRKVNGAKIIDVVLLLNSDNVKWMFIAFVIACPIGWHLLSVWLEKFAFKTDLNWWIFGLSGLISLGIALVTVTYQSYKAAVMNPVDAIRVE